ncbi:MAG TPA: hypothetical protein VE954_22170 [Oligoflexus sp.]|uniref:hypothetical protein n=1 Tax=Oligoflexus sp. TaxID=1971216 RepID=UPI002D27EF45|nr:hypothetical protein [Oligoflexus sp.]HYX35814.1 hypothetical protein [Oligoflexus sp.]
MFSTVLFRLMFFAPLVALELTARAQSLPFNIYQGPSYKGVRQWSELGEWIGNSAVQTSIMQVPGYTGLYMNVWTGQYYSVTPEGDIDLSRSGQNYEGSLAAWNTCMDNGGGNACYTRVDYRIKRILQVY